jgi:hypothetical protein
MGVIGEDNFVKVAGRRLLQGSVMVRSLLWDGEIEIATIPDYCAYLRVMSWVDVFDVKDTAAVRVRYEEERARGGYGIPELRGVSEKTVCDPNELVRLEPRHRGQFCISSNSNNFSF